MILYYDNIHICFIHIYIHTHIIYKKCTCLSVPLGRGWVSVQMFMYIGMRRQKLDKMARDLAKKGKGSICLTARENHGPKNWNKWVTQSRTTTKQLPNNYQTTTKRILLCSFFRSLGDVSSDLQVCANSEEKFIGHVRTHFVSLVWRILKVRTVWICSWCICNMSYGAVSGRFGTAEELQQSNLLSCGPNMWAMER